MVKTELGLGETCAPGGCALSGGTMAATRPRPLSPHLTIWRWGPHMVVSILHRATGIALSVAGLAVLTWWLMAVAKGGDTYATFDKASHSWIGIVILIGLSWSFFQHFFSGIRHLVMDSGAAFELHVNKVAAILTMVGSVVLTVVLWVWLLEFAK